MKRFYSKGCSIILIIAIYLIASLIGWLVFRELTGSGFLSLPILHPLWALFVADVIATIVVWAWGLVYENVSVYDPYWSVFPPIAFLLWGIYTSAWSLPVIV